MPETGHSATSLASSPPPSATADSSSSSEDGIDLFTEPSDYYAPPAAPTYVDYTFTPPHPSPSAPTQHAQPSQPTQPTPSSTLTPASSPQPLTLHLRLVGHNPLWGHHLWNAGRVLASYLQTHRTRLVHGRRIWELGAGAGLPSLVAWACGARQVLVTDYPDAELVENLEMNVGMVRERVKEWLDGEGHEGQDNARSWEGRYGEIKAEGYLWGRPLPTIQPQSDDDEVSNDTTNTDTDNTTTSNPKNPSQPTSPSSSSSSFPPSIHYDTLILGDLLFNHSEHAQLVRSVELGLARHESAVALVFFTPYRPWLLAEDLKFFERAERAGLEVRSVGEQVMPEVMFREDRGDERLRRTVFMYELRWRMGGG